MMLFGGGEVDNRDYGDLKKTAIKETIEEIQFEPFNLQQIYPERPSPQDMYVVYSARGILNANEKQASRENIGLIAIPKIRLRELANQSRGDLDFGRKLLDCVNNNQVADNPEVAVEAAGWFWTSNNLNHYADLDNIEDITRKINGGLNGLKERKTFLESAKRVLGCRDT